MWGLPVSPSHWGRAVQPEQHERHALWDGAIVSQVKWVPIEDGVTCYWAEPGCLVPCGMLVWLAPRWVELHGPVPFRAAVWMLNATWMLP